jgi:hypothetical protein
MDGRVSIPGCGRDPFSLRHESRPALSPTQFSIKWVPGFLSEVKRPGRKSDHSPTSRAEVKKAWSYSSTPPYVCVQWILIKHKIKPSWRDSQLITGDNFTLLLILIPCYILSLMSKYSPQHPVLKHSQSMFFP